MIIPAYMHSVRIGFFTNTIYMFESIRKIAKVGIIYIFFKEFIWKNISQSLTWVCYTSSVTITTLLSAFLHLKTKLIFVYVVPIGEVLQNKSNSPEALLNCHLMGILAGKEFYPGALDAQFFIPQKYRSNIKQRWSRTRNRCQLQAVHIALEKRWDRIPIADASVR